MTRLVGIHADTSNLLDVMQCVDELDEWKWQAYDGLGNVQQSLLFQADKTKISKLVEAHLVKILFIAHR